MEALVAAEAIDKYFGTKQVNRELTTLLHTERFRIQLARMQNDIRGNLPHDQIKCVLYFFRCQSISLILIANHRMIPTDPIMNRKFCPQL